MVFQPGTKAQQIEQELKRTIIKLQSRLRLMDTVFESLSDGVAVADKHGRYLLANHAAERIVGMGVHVDGVAFNKWSQLYGVFRPDEETPLPSHELPIIRAIHGAESDVELFSAQCGEAGGASHQRQRQAPPERH